MVDTATPHTTDLFIGLTPDRVLQAVERAGLACRPVCYPLNSFENRVYEVELEDRARVVAKFYRPGRWTEAQILEEHRLLDALAAAEVPVCTMRPFPDGGALRQIDGIYYSVADRRGGRAPDELSDALVLRLGRLIGRMHTVAAARPGDDVDRPRLDADRYVRRPLAWMRTNDVIPPSFRQRYAAAAETIADRADALMLGVPTQLVHGDLHLGNLLLRDDRLNVLDFDDCCIGPAVQDLWLVLPGRGPEADRHRALLLEGYQEFRAFDHASLGLIEVLRGLRMVRYTGWIARRWHDPAFPAAWPDFATEEHWRTTTEDLEDQAAIVRGDQTDDAVSDGLTALPPRGETEDVSHLTNKDYFWDWEDEG